MNIFFLYFTKRYEHFFYILEIIKAPIFHEMKICIIVDISPSYIFIFLSLSLSLSLSLLSKSGIQIEVSFDFFICKTKQNKQTYQQDFLKERNYIKPDLLMPAIYKTLICLFFRLTLFKEMPVF